MAGKVLYKAWATRAPNQDAINVYMVKYSAGKASQLRFTQKGPKWQEYNSMDILAPSLVIPGVNLAGKNIPSSKVSALYKILEAVASECQLPEE